MGEMDNSEYENFPLFLKKKKKSLNALPSKQINYDH